MLIFRQSLLFVLLDGGKLTGRNQLVESCSYLADVPGINNDRKRDLNFSDIYFKLNWEVLQRVIGSILDHYRKVSLQRS